MRPIETGHEEAIYSVSFSPDGTTLATGSDDKTVKLIDVGSASVTKTIETGHEGTIYSVSFSPDGTTLATGSGDRTVKLIDVGSASVTKTIETGHEKSITSVSFSPDGTTLATGSADKTVKLLEPARYGYGPDGLLLAHPTFDLWSYGVVLYYAIAHKPLLETTGADQLRGKAERVKLARWSTADLTYAINDLDHGECVRVDVWMCGCVDYFEVMSV